MTSEQKKTIVEAQQVEGTVLLITVNADQLAVAARNVLDLDAEKLQDMAERAFNSALKGKMQAAINAAIKAKYMAECRGRINTAADCEKEIQNGTKLMNNL